MDETTKRYHEDLDRRHAAYLEQKHRRMPWLKRLQDHIKRGGTVMNFPRDSKE